MGLLTTGVTLNQEFLATAEQKCYLGHIKSVIMREYNTGLRNLTAVVIQPSMMNLSVTELLSWKLNESTAFLSQQTIRIKSPVSS